MTVAVPDALLERLYRKADAARWRLSRERFAQALDASLARAPGGLPGAGAVERYLEALHLSDLATACACASGDEAAWEHVVLQLRPVLYRAAHAIDASGGARDLADSIYAELYGLDDRGRQRPSLFSYYHGRSSLATWVRAVLSQRHVDRVRAARRFEPLPEIEPEERAPSTQDPDRSRWHELVNTALMRSIETLEPRDRLRLAAYYVDGATLAEIGRMLGEHEGTVSRHLSRIRKSMRTDIERHLKEHGLGPEEIVQCVSSVSDDTGPIDLGRVLRAQDDRGAIVQGTRGGL